MPLVPKPGYIYRFHRHHPGPTEPKAQQSPHISPGTSVTGMANADVAPVPSAHYYPSTWESHPMLPPGHMDVDPRAVLGGATASRIKVQPTPQRSMSVDSGSSATPPGDKIDDQELGMPGADSQGQPLWSDCMCCAQMKVARAARGLIFWYVPSAPPAY
ncbi:hypothetical protein QFC20_004344 [Naganishia adeliensis]|uniref:Uncharacterized protein n=1 Tax=Naganishia adeliensis TaxID=92952 RepID=A0ACC2W1V9_9TREE|nr:hypothetical protein QFC20_004344 [Naganishia adeliensis]